MGDKRTEVNEVVLQQMKNFNLTKSLLQAEISGLYGSELLKDMNKIIEYYDIYTNGADFTPATNKDFIGAKLRYKIAKGLINREARFLFSIPPEISIKPRDDEDTKDKENVSQMQSFVKTVLGENGFSSKLVKAARDCFIGKRIAIVANFNESGISISFVPSLEFVFETDPNNVNVMTKFVQFYSTVVSNKQTEQRIYKKKYWLENGFCHFSEAVYNGVGRIIETIYEDEKTEFTYIPAWVITNEGLSGDPFGESELEDLADVEAWYSKLSSKDMDSIGKGADQIKYAIDIAPDATKDLSVNAGAFWDLNTDPTAPEGVQGLVGVLDNDMSYSEALDNTLKRLKTTMYEMVEVPDTTSEALKGIVTSGKTLKAIYWGLMTRCNEKMLVWRPAIQKLVKCLIDGAELYPEIRKLYTDDKLEVNGGFFVTVENNYPLPEDEYEERQADGTDVINKTRSRKTYMQKWQGMTDNEADMELDQILKEKQYFEEETFPAGTETGSIKSFLESDEDDE